jgi:hypothetical protein
MTEKPMENRFNNIFDELADLHNQDLQFSQYRDLASNEPLIPVPLTAFTELDKRSLRRAEPHKQLRQLAIEKWGPPAS